mmetsp:Transcript_93957/g.242794  ORF Transcript_93957/g.242794 Transcript_93957/m.242794 type:complete len:289 (-) Transcript_93957:1145-2011(-)
MASSSSSCRCTSASSFRFFTSSAGTSSRRASSRCFTTRSSTSNLATFCCTCSSCEELRSAASSILWTLCLRSAQASERATSAPISSSCFFRRTSSSWRCRSSTPRCSSDSLSCTRCRSARTTSAALVSMALRRAISLRCTSVSDFAFCISFPATAIFSRCWSVFCLRLLLSSSRQARSRLLSSFSSSRCRTRSCVDARRTRSCLSSCSISFRAAWASRVLSTASLALSCSSSLSALLRSSLSFVTRWFNVSLRLPRSCIDSFWIRCSSLLMASAILSRTSSIFLRFSS